MDLHELMEKVASGRKRNEQRYEQNLAKLCRLERETRTMAAELEIGKRLAAAEKRNSEVKMQLIAANRTVAERKAYDAEIRRGQILFANVIPEAHPDWREHAKAAFGSQYPQVHYRTGKKA
jgi:hypothetical protein